MGTFKSIDNSVVTLVNPGDTKVNVIKCVRAETGWGLKKSKMFVDDCPISFDKMDQKKADQLARKLESAGATVKVLW